MSTVSPLLSGSHFIELIALDTPLKCQFYTEMCKIELRSVRDLRRKIEGVLYERTAISKQPYKVIKKELNDLQTKKKFSEHLVFKDPYILDLPSNFSEKTLENASIDELCQFLQEIRDRFLFY